MLTYENPSLDIAYRSERSIEDELERMSKSDVPTIIVSYIIMFIYISLALGKTSQPSKLLVSTVFGDSFTDGSHRKIRWTS